MALDVHQMSIVPIDLKRPVTHAQAHPNNPIVRHRDGVNAGFCGRGGHRRQKLFNSKYVDARANSDGEGCGTHLYLKSWAH